MTAPQPPIKPPVPDEQLSLLVEQAREGGDAAREALYGHFRPQLGRLAKSRGVEEPDGLADEVLTKVMARLDRIEGSGIEVFRAYLFQAARNAIANEQKRQARRPHLVPLDSGHEAALGITTESPEETVSSDDWFDSVAGELTEAQRQVIELRFKDDMTVAETAETLRVHPVAVKSLQRRALVTLRAAVAALAVIAALWLLVGRTGPEPTPVDTGFNAPPEQPTEPPLPETGAADDEQSLATDDEAEEGASVDQPTATPTPTAPPTPTPAPTESSVARGERQGSESDVGSGTTGSDPGLADAEPSDQSTDSGGPVDPPADGAADAGNDDSSSGQAADEFGIGASVGDATPAPEPTPSPEPTATSTPSPTPTPEPTATGTPTPTPEPAPTSVPFTTAPTLPEGVTVLGGDVIVTNGTTLFTVGGGFVSITDPAGTITVVNGSVTVSEVLRTVRVDPSGLVFVDDGNAKITVGPSRSVTVSAPEGTVSVSPTGVVLGSGPDAFVDTRPDGTVIVDDALASIALSPTTLNVSTDTTTIDAAADGSVLAQSGNTTVAVGGGAISVTATLGTVDIASSGGITVDGAETSIVVAADGSVSIDGPTGAVSLGPGGMPIEVG